MHCALAAGLAPVSSDGGLMMGGGGALRGAGGFGRLWAHVHVQKMGEIVFPQFFVFVCEAPSFIRLDEKGSKI